MTTDEFNDWRKLLEARSGMVVSEQRRSFLQVNLTARVRELGITDYGSYYQQVIAGPSGAEAWVVLLHRLTEQETRLFRHAPSFAVVPEFLSETIHTQSAPPLLALWRLAR